VLLLQAQAEAAPPAPEVLDVFLTLTGACVASTPLPNAVNFACAVRASASQQITLANPSSSAWSLRPVIQVRGAECVHARMWSQAYA